MKTLPHSVLAVLFASILSLPAWAQVDMAAATRELDTMFDRPQGTVISQEQKDKLRAFLQRHEGQDLGRLGYAKALDHYFRRDPAAGVAVLDAFFAEHEGIANAEHATMAGRIYLVAILGEVRGTTPDVAKVSLWGERLAALYLDLQTVGRACDQVLDRVEDAAPFRMSVVRGLVRSKASEAEKDQFLTRLYAQRTKLPPPGSDVVPTAGQQFGGVTPAPSAGSKGTENPLSVPVVATVGGEAGFTLEGLRGKVVVVDLFASWCPPCRAAINPLQTLVDKHGDQVAMVVMTRFYGRGMDFEAGATPPHGGKAVNNLDQAAEIALYERFVKAFSMKHPVVFTSSEAWQKQLAAEVVPTTLVVGRDGKLVGRVVGGSDAARDQVQSLIERAMAGG